MFLRRYERRSGGRTANLLGAGRVGSHRHADRGSGWWPIWASWRAANKAAGRNSDEVFRASSGRSRRLFDPPHYDDPSDDEPVLVDLSGVRLERLRDFGDVWMALGLWRLLGLDTLLQNVAEPGREEVPWPVVAAILTIARFCKPSSELHIETTWYRGTALEDLLGVSVEKVHTDRLYEGLDWLLPHKAAIEKHLKERLGRAVRSGVRPAVVRRDEHVLRGPVRGQSAWRSAAIRATAGPTACKSASAWW